MTLMTGMSISGKMSFGVWRNDAKPAIKMAIAITAKV